MSKINASSYFNAPSALGGYTISQSLRFGADTGGGYLSKTFGQAGTDWTLSAWVKRSSVDVWSPILAASSTGNPYYQSFFGFQSTGEIVMYQFNNGGSKTTNVISTAKFRDVSAWYHVVCQYDEGSNVTIYVNGEQVAQGANGSTDRYINKTTYPHYIGNYTYQSNPGGNFHGYMAEMHFVDGSLLEPEDFGVSENGIWLPKFYEGSHGTNGFYLPFDDSSDIGADRSGNDNDFAATTLVASDVVLDTPANNFPIILNDEGATSQVYTEGALHANISSNSYAAKSSMFVPMDSGKWYVEALSDATSGSGAGLGTYTTNSMNTLSSISYYFTGNIVLATDMIHYYSSGSIYEGGSSSQSSLTTVGDKDIIGMLIDTDAKTVQFYVNGTASGTAETMANTTDPVAAQLHGHNSRPFMFNFGTDSSFANRKTSGSANATDANGIGDFYYTPPTGAKAICSKNLPEPSIGPLSGEQPADYFNTILYTGTGATVSRTGVGFQPDWVWAKARSVGYGHRLYDSVRGVQKALYANTNNNEEAGADGSDGLTSFDSDGFSTGNHAGVNASGTTYVAWNWLAGGTAVSNTDGSITSSVSANTKAGFSIVSYTGTATAGTVGHGLDSAPEMIIQKMRDPSAAENWTVFHKDLSSDNYALRLNTTGAEFDGSGNYFSATSATTFSIGSTSQVNENTKGSIAYCFHSVPGYSKMGSYAGNGGSDGTYVYTGFRPAWVMSKRTNSTGYWNIFDVERDVNDGTGKQLWANDGGTEASSSGNLIDILSNGFKMRGTGTDTNGSGSNYIYIAFAEQPFKYSNAR